MVVVVLKGVEYVNVMVIIGDVWLLIIILKIKKESCL